MLRNQHLKLNLAVLLILVLFSICAAGCAQAEKKPPGTDQNQKPVKKSAVNPKPEVEKYQEEPVISLFRKATGQKQSLKLEEYLKGVVAAEIGPKFPMEALKAQAIIARTMTLALLEYENGTRGIHGTDASDDHTEFQAYNEKEITDNISKAVDETRGQVLTYQGKFVYALFHSASKDKTASIEEGFPKLKEKASAYIEPVATGGLKLAPEKYRSWTVKVPKYQVQQIMGLSENLYNISISKRGPSGRVTEVSANKDKARIAGVDLREKVGFDKLFSTQMEDISIEGNQVVFKGAGWGHGVGMEQWGANAMAQDGKKAAEIATHYFPKTTLTQLYK